MRVRTRVHACIQVHASVFDLVPDACMQVCMCVCVHACACVCVCMCRFL